MTFLVNMPITGPWIATICLWRNCVMRLANGYRLPYLFRSIRFVTDDVAVFNRDRIQYWYGVPWIMFLSGTQPKWYRIAETIDKGMQFGVQPTARDPYCFGFPLFLPPLALWWTRIQVESIHRFSISASVYSAWNSFSSTLSSRHLQKREYTVFHDPYRSGNSRHCAPLRTIHIIPFSIVRSSLLGLPRCPSRLRGRYSSTRAHCSSVNSYLFTMPLLYYICFFQTSPNALLWFSAYSD